MDRLFASEHDTDLCPEIVDAGFNPKKLPKSLQITDDSWRKALEVLDLFEKSGSKRKVKQEAIEANMKCRALKRCVEYAYNPYKKYFVYPGRAKKSPFGKNDMPRGIRLSQFLWVLQRLENRKVTGNKARELLDTAIAWGNPMERKWFRKVANRDFKSGISRSTFNKYWPKLVPSFNVPLSDKYEQHEVTFPVWGEIKFDGHRMFVVYDPKTGVHNLSRQGKEKENVGHIHQAVLDIAASSPYEAFVLDGELFGNSFNDTGLASRKATSAANVEAARALKFWVFDMVPLSAFKEGLYDVPLKKRRKVMKDFLSKDKTGYLKLSKRSILKSEEEVAEYYAKAVDDGHEGAMIKDPNSPYECTRNAHWLKLKPNHDVTVEVIDVFEGTGKNAGRMGALQVKLEDGTETNVGGGWRDDCKGHQRGKCPPEHYDCRVCLWKHRKKIKGWLLDVKTEKTTAIDTKKLRHARFAGRWRHDML